VASSRLVCSFRNHPIHGTAIVVVSLVWVAAAKFHWLESVVFLSHISMAAFLYTAITAWRADVPNKEEQDDDARHRA
jgi:hypothetical protein